MNAIERAAKNCRRAFPNPNSKTWIGKWVWCCHHEKRLEVLTEPPANRIEYILTSKPEPQRVVRLDNFRPVLTPLPGGLIKAGDACVKAWDAYVKAWDAYDKAGDACDKAGDACVKAGDAYVKAGDAYVKARDAYVKARDAYVKAWDAYDKSPACDKAHRKDVPHHTWNRKSIFEE